MCGMPCCLVSASKLLHHWLLDLALKVLPCAAARVGRAREHLLARKAANLRDLRRVCGEQHGVRAQRLSGQVHQVAQVHLVVEGAEAVLVLYLRVPAVPS